MTALTPSPILSSIRSGMLVKRFHTQSILREDTVGHHSANVAALIIWLCHPSYPSSEILCAAILHDVGEYRTGDTPAQVKWGSKTLKDELDRLEKLGWKNSGWNDPKFSLTSDDERMLKFCDIAELCLKCIHEVELGNKTVVDIGNRCIEKLDNMLSSSPLDSRFMGKANNLVNFMEGVLNASEYETNWRGTLQV